MSTCPAKLTFACQIKFKESLLRYNTACYSESRYEECWSNKSPSPQLDVQSANRSGRVAEGYINPLISRSAKKGEQYDATKYVQLPPVWWECSVRRRFVRSVSQ